MVEDLTSLQLPKDTVTAIEEQTALFQTTSSQSHNPIELGEVAENLGVFTSGELRFGNGILPGSGFSGLRIAYPPEILDYENTTWNIVGIENDILQVGIRASDGRLSAGAGAVELSVDGITIETDEGSGGIPNQILFVSPGDHSIDYAFINNELASSISTLQIISNNSGNASAGGRAQLVAKNAGGDSASFGVFSGTAGIVATLSLNSKNFFDADETNGIITFNLNENDIDFRIAANSITNAFFLEGSTGNIGIGGIPTLGKLEVVGNLAIGGSNNELRIYEGINYTGFTVPALSADTMYVLPAGDGSANQVLQTDGAKNLDWVTNTPVILDADLTDVTVTNTTTKTTFYSLSIPANTLGTGNVIRVHLKGAIKQNTAGDRDITIEMVYGTTIVATSTITLNNGLTLERPWALDALLFADGATNIQEASIYGTYRRTGDANIFAGAFGTGAEDSTGALTLAFKIQWSAAAANLVFVYKHSIVEGLNI